MNDAEPTAPPKHAATDLPPESPPAATPAAPPLVPTAAPTTGSILPTPPAGPRVISWTTPPVAGPPSSPAETSPPATPVHLDAAAPLASDAVADAPPVDPRGSSAPAADTALIETTVIGAVAVTGTRPGDDEVYALPVEPPPPRRALRVVAVLAAIVALVIAGSVTVWAVDRPGTLPEDVLPAEGAAAFVRLDYDPAVTEAFTAYRFAQAYSDAADQAPRAPLSVGRLGWLFSPMLAGTTLTVRSDVEPWAGDKAGVLLRQDGLVVVAVELDGDEALAETFLDEYASQTGAALGYSFDRGYVVISDTTLLADHATDVAAGGGDLAGDPTFAADVSELEASRLGVVWAALGAVPPSGTELTFSRLVRDTVDAEVGGITGVARGALTAGSLLDRVYTEVSGAQVEGRLVLGMSMRADGISLEGRLRGLTVNGRVAGAPAVDAAPVAPVEETVTTPSIPAGVFGVRAVPADTVLVAGVKGLDAALIDLVTPADPAAPGDPAAPAGPAASDAGSAAEPAGPDVTGPTAEQVPPADGSAVGEAVSLVGTDTAVGLLGGGGVVVRAAGTDPAAVALAVIDATGDSPVEVLAETGATDTTSVVTTGEVVDATPLDNIPAFSQVLPGIDDAIALFYVNLDWATFTQDMDALAPFSTFGLGVSRTDVPGDFAVSARLLIDELYAGPGATPSGDPSSPSSPGASPESSPGAGEPVS